ncbi:MAG: NAD(P)/FAD-dependent oxidoreductase [Alphaproteobacteria bacterium]|nr:NAD(P)/FAD-dependent oxidoreductase [Alphaproteobacteria bacterium]
MGKPGDASCAAEHVDVLIVGAGISGIGSAYHLQQQCPGTTFAILEKMESFGGTWLTHRYPGIRSDTDLYTYGYRFKPWTGVPLATADEIRAYMAEIIAENGLARHIRYRHRIVTARWSSAERRWSVEAQVGEAGETRRFTCGFLWMCQGYYRHEQGYTPDWPGFADFAGRVVHPQTWPDDLDLTGRKVVVIGSGATAATLIPAIAGSCGHVTMLQRSPTYFRIGRNAVPIADELRALGIDERWIHEIVRRRILHDTHAFHRRTFSEPEAVKKDMIDGIRRHLGSEAIVDEHFTPRYRPWQQRMVFVPDADVFKQIEAGQVSVVTDEIERFEPKGIRVRSGALLEADIVVTATGFHLSVMGDIDFVVDGRPVDWPETVTYRGMMFTGVPNLAWIFGYFRASWTLRSDMVGDFVCRLLNHMKATGAGQVMPMLRPEDADMKLGPWVDPENFNPGYIMRQQHLLPRRGDKPEWQHLHDYWAEKDQLPAIDLTDRAFVYA